MASTLRKRRICPIERVPEVQCTCNVHAAIRAHELSRERLRGRPMPMHSQARTRTLPLGVRGPGASALFDRRLDP